MKSNLKEKSLEQNESFQKSNIIATPSQSSEVSDANHPGPASESTNEEEGYYICDLTGTKVKMF